MEKKIVICIGTDRSKHLRARLSLLLVEDGRILSECYHSINIHPGADLDAIRAANEEHLANPDGGIPGAPWPAIPDSEWEMVKRHIAIIHTPEVIAEYRGAQI